MTRRRRKAPGRIAGALALALCLSSVLSLAACSAEHGTRRGALGGPPPAEPGSEGSSGEVEPRDTELEDVDEPVDEDGEALAVETVAAAHAVGPQDPAGEPSGASWTDPCLEVSELEAYDVLEHFYRDFAHGDWSAMGQRFWPGASVIAVRRRAQDSAKEVVTESIEACIERLRAQVARTKPLEIAIVEYRIEATGAIAQASVKSSVIDKSGDAPQSWTGTDAFTLVRHDNQWRIVALVMGSGSFGP